MIRLVLPAFNEEAALSSLLARVAALELAEPLGVIVVDDGSVDASAEVARAAGDRLRLELIQHPRNLGLGAAMRTGLGAALERGSPGDLVATMDADDTHPPELLGGMLAAITRGADVVVASRYARGAEVLGLSLPRRLLSRAAAVVARPIVRAPGVRDFTCGYRLYRHDLLERAREQHGGRLVEESGFACMLELLIKCARLGARFDEVPLELRYDRKRGASKMRVARTVVASLRILWRAR